VSKQHLPNCSAAHFGGGCSRPCPDEPCKPWCGKPISPEQDGLGHVRFDKTMTLVRFCSRKCEEKAEGQLLPNDEQHGPRCWFWEDGEHLYLIGSPALLNGRLRAAKSCHCGKVVTRRDDPNEREEWRAP